jgi:predicted homoserine dehydrogenase-like protein
MGTLARLQSLERAGRPIRVAVIGAGQMGGGLVRQVGGLPGMRVAAVADIVIDRAASAAAAAGIPVERARAASDISRIAGAGRAAISERAGWIVDSPAIDAILDATGDPEAGARLALAAIGRRKPLITMNIEADATVGPLLAWMARAADAMYTIAAGDEPSVLCEMVDFARVVGLEVVCAGKGKNNRLDRTATMKTVEAEAVARGMSPRMLAAFVDGTKTMAEMASLANATGLAPDVRGMHGPRADLADLLRVFVPRPDGGILGRRGAVEYAVGDVAPGVFVIVASSSDAVRRDLAYLKAGEGPYYLLHRPYHLASLEAPISVARAVLWGEPTMQAAGAPVAECVAAAKRDLRAGEVLDGIGGETVYGLIDTASAAAAAGAVPLGIARGARLRRDVPAGAVLTDADLVLDERLVVVGLRRVQDALVREGTLPPVMPRAPVPAGATGA